MLGIFTALGTAVLWAANAVFFAEGAKRIDALSVSLLRLILASVILVGLHLVLGGRFNFGLGAWFWLGISGIIALAVGDWFLFAALGKIGPRIVMLVMSLSPVFAAIIAWIFLAETLSLWAVGGIVLTVGGIMMVVLNKKSNRHLERRTLIIGVVYSVLAALGQGLGMVLGDVGMELLPTACEDIRLLDILLMSVNATMVRVLVAGLAVSLTTLVIGKTRKVIQSAKNPKAMLFVVLGTVIGLIMGTLLMFTALKYTKVGIASTLISISPLLLVPASRIIYKEKITPIAIVGSVVTLAGVALLMLFPR
ncbi:DMT family transporter [candidate division WOR-3 bacterium]|nr:DMT family transporter [candidate division WOR-3 bacterium]